jgi:hypothetical protein
LANFPYGWLSVWLVTLTKLNKKHPSQIPALFVVGKTLPKLKIKKNVKMK